MRVATPEIYEDLQRKLVTAEFKPGEKLKPAELQGAYGCAPNTIRDVLLRLSTVGLVEFEMQRGFRAAESSPERRTDVTKFRIMLEQEGASLSIQNGDLSWEARLSAAHHQLSHIEKKIARDGSGDVGLWSDAEYDFHQTLISACNSPMLLEVFSHTYVQFRQQMVSQERDFGSDYFESIIGEHQAILDAALARNDAACRAAIYDHLKRNL